MSDVKAVVREGEKAITPDEAKKLIGWTEERGEVDKWDHWDLAVNGVKVRLANRKANRPLRLSLSKRYALEFLRGKWQLNGETIVVDAKGCVQNGQHRLVGLILADLMKANDAHWKEYGRATPILETILVTGVSAKAEVVDTMDMGQKRSLGDVLFRRREFGKDGNEKTQKRLADTLASAIRLTWIRTGGMSVSDAPHFPHSEALDFIETHSKLTDAVAKVVELEAGSERRISSKLSLAYAAGLLYLGATAKTKPEGEISFTLWKKAEEFWTAFAEGEGLTKGSPVLALRRALDRGNSGSGTGRDEILGMCVKAFNAFLEGEKVETKDLKIKKVTENGKRVAAEYPRIGGLDVEIEEEAEEEIATPGDEDEKPKRRKAKATDDSDGEEGVKAKSNGKLSKNGDGNLFGKGAKVIVTNEEEGNWAGVVLGTRDGDKDLLRIKSDADGETYAVATELVKLRKKAG